MFRRTLATLFALWFAIVLGDPGVLHSCPMHGSHANHGSSATMDHTSHSHAAAQHDGSAPKNTECTCVGHCCAAPAAVHTPTVATFVVPAFVAQPTAYPDLPSIEAPRAPDLLLPFGNGPPHASHVA